MRRIRMDDASHHAEDKLPRHFNFLNVVEQAMEVEFAESNGFSVVLFLFMAIFLFVSGERGGECEVCIRCSRTLLCPCPRSPSLPADPAQRQGHVCAQPARPPDHDCSEDEVPEDSGAAGRHLAL